jgi:two-component system response regulator AtoC
MARRKTNPTEKTKRIPIQERRAVAPLGAPPRVAWITAYPHGGLSVRHLPAGESVIVGREASEPGEFAIDDPCLSRKHAEFVLGADGVVVRDLGSTNGLHVRGRRVREATLKPGDELYLGTLRVVIHGDTEATTSAQASSYTRLRAAFDEEITRSTYLGRPCTLMMVRRRWAEPRAEAHVSRFLEAVLKLLRPFDRLALFSEEILAVLLPEMSRAAASELASLLAEPPLALDAGIATFRQDGRTADALEERCFAALHSDTRRGVRSEGRPEPRYGRDGGVVVAESLAMRELFREIDRLAGSELSIVIQGDTGAGKEIVARHVHATSKRRGKPLVVINCAAIAPTLIESTLFGHERGSFTGAIGVHRGLFEEADGGTLLLDEVAELPLTTQAAVLRVLEAKRVRRVGGSHEIEVDTRVMAATHRDLAAMVVEGTFRKDLYYRLNGCTIHVPALRERPEDVEALAFRFITETCAKDGSAPPGLSPSAMGLLKGYAWPGNVRELKNVIARAVALCGGRVILPHDLPEQITRGSASQARAATDGVRAGEHPILDLEGMPPTYREALEHFERWLLSHALYVAGGGSKKAAARLGLPVRTLRHRIRHLGIRYKDT